MNKLYLYVFLLIGSYAANAQITKDVRNRVNANIQGYELNEFLKDADSYKTEIVVDKINDLRLDCSLSYQSLPVEFKYPNPRIQLFGFKKQGLNCGEYILSKTVYDARDLNIYLIGIDTTSTKDIKPIIYISGQMFLDNIDGDFEFDLNNPNGFADYIALKRYDLQIEQLEFQYKKSRKLYFKAYSKFYSQNLILSIEPNSKEHEIRIEKWL